MQYMYNYVINNYIKIGCLSNKRDIKNTGNLRRRRGWKAVHGIVRIEVPDFVFHPRRSTPHHDCQTERSFKGQQHRGGKGKKGK
jgi:hypothetical protein